MSGSWGGGALNQGQDSLHWIVRINSLNMVCWESQQKHLKCRLVKLGAHSGLTWLARASTRASSASFIVGSSGDRQVRMAKCWCIVANFFKGAPSRKKGAKKGAFFRKKGQKRGKKKGLPYIQTSINYYILIFSPFTSALHLFTKNVPYLPC